MNPSLIQLLDQSQSIVDLEEKLIPLGYKFDTTKCYLYWLDQQWSKIAADRKKQALDTDISNKFPALTVESEGVQYMLHGLVHGGSPDFAPGWTLNRKVRQSVSTLVNSFHDPSRGTDYLYEQNFNHLFDFIADNELRDVDETAEPEPHKNGPLSAFYLIGRAISQVFLPSFFAALYWAAMTTKKPEEFYLAQKALHDPQSLSLFADYSMAREMPQPFDLEKEYLLEKSSHFQAFIHTAWGIPIATSPERSLWTACELLDYAEDHHLKKLHYIGGLAHITEIAYFLKNPNYSFEKLENYWLSKNQDKNKVLNFFSQLLK